MKLKKLKRKLKSHAAKELLRGRLSMDEFRKVFSVANNDAALAELNRKLPAVRYGSTAGAWANFWDWFVANWPDILNLILTLAPLFLEEHYEEDQ